LDIYLSVRIFVVFFEIMGKTWNRLQYVGSNGM